MDTSFEYIIEDNKVIITKCPKVLNSKMILDIRVNRGINVVQLCEGIEIIDDLAFGCFWGLEEIILPNSLKEIKNKAFRYCENLEHIRIPDNVTEIGEYAFEFCDGLKEEVLPSKLKEISGHLFYKCKRLNKIELPNSVEIIHRNAFSGCESLNEILFSSNIKRIEENVFFDCKQLERISIPEGVETILGGAFINCYNLKEVILPSSLQELSSCTFSFCRSLEKVIVPEGVKKIKKTAFQFCDNLKEIVIPSSVESIEKWAFYSCNYLEIIIFNKGDKKLAIDMKDVEVISNNLNVVFLYNKKKDCYSFYYEGKYIEFEGSLLTKNKNIKKLIENKFFDRNDYMRLYYWARKKFIPNKVIVNNMPISEINSFFVNNNCKEWGKLVYLSNIKKEINLGTFFKLCYVLGVFNESVTIRDRAVKFIEGNIIGKMSEDEMHSRFDGFDLNNGYNSEYAKFFMKYFNTIDFMKTEDISGEEIDLLASSYNNFYKVKQVYPSKILNTNRNVDILLPMHVMEAIRFINYNNVDKKNEQLAKYVGRYGYSQKQFEEIQTIFNIGKNLDEKEIKLFISSDGDYDLKYSLLEKDDPLGVVLGNITNCCQILGAQGESCVKYGITQPNSKFMTFNYNNTIIGQSWVWYD